MMDVITLSSKGQLVIPKEIRGEMGLVKEDKFVLVHDRDSILLKRIGREEARRAMLKLLDKFSDEFRKHKITSNDVKKEIRNVRFKR